jgi:isopentenyl diphosphate isomerase/L-lactate dehydrogenase-like FMN-dependent dehydrogenase
MTELLNFADYERAAHEKLPGMFYDYIAGGATDEITLRANRDAYDHIWLRPRVLVDVSHIDLSTTLLNVPFAMPVMLSVTAAQKLCHPQGEIAVASAAHRIGISSMVGNLSNFTINEVKAVSAGPVFFQLYVYKDERLNQHVIDQSVEGGAAGLVITVDTPLVGRRERDLRNDFKLPPDNIAAHLREVTLPAADGKERKGAAGMLRADDLRSQRLTWRDLERYRHMAGGMPLLLKGILTAEDAELAIQHGVDAIIVSNHGGRQLDTAIPTILALPEIVDAVAGRIPVLVDGGIRRGTDVVKALAIGANAVLLGRPMAWALAVNGEAGVHHLLSLLEEEIRLTMALCGRTHLKELDRSVIRLP